MAMVVVSVFVLSLAACGGDDDDTAEPESTTAESTTTTAAQLEQADQATVDLASAAVLQAGDFPEGWTQVSEAEQWTPNDESCGAVDGGGPEDTLVAGAAVNGPSMQLGEQPGFVSSRSYVFPTEADAIAWVDIAKSDAWGECERSRMEKAYYPDGGGQLSIVRRDNEALGQSGFEAYLQLTSEDRVSANVTFSIYRLGRTVIRTGIEDGGTGEDFQTLVDAEYSALTPAYDRVNALG